MFESHLAASVTEEWACASLVSVTNSFETCIQKNDCKRCISCHKNEIQICSIPNSSSQLFHYITSNTSTKLLVESSPLLDIVRMRSHGMLCFVHCGLSACLCLQLRSTFNQTDTHAWTAVETAVKPGSYIYILPRPHRRNGFTGWEPPSERLTYINIRRVPQGHNSKYVFPSVKVWKMWFCFYFCYFSHLVNLTFVSIFVRLNSIITRLKCFQFIGYISSYKDSWRWVVIQVLKL